MTDLRRQIYWILLGPVCSEFCTKKEVHWIYRWSKYLKLFMRITCCNVLWNSKPMHWHEVYSSFYNFFCLEDVLLSSISIWIRFPVISIMLTHFLLPAIYRSYGIFLSDAWANLKDISLLNYYCYALFYALSISGCVNLPNYMSLCPWFLLSLLCIGRFILQCFLNLIVDMRSHSFGSHVMDL